MPRQLRLEYEGAVYHVLARGNRRQSIYRDDRDRLAWLDFLSRACQRTGWRVSGWVLMGNHYHLLVKTPRANLVSGMQWLQTAYTVWFNRRHSLSGHLFGGRYKAVLIDEGAPQSNMLYGYLGTVLDYLHLNPVRAGIVGGRSSKSLLDYRWSSLTGAYLCSPRKRPKWVDVETAFPLFGLKDSAAGRRRFLERLELTGTRGIRSPLRSEDSGGTIPPVHLEKGMVFWEPGLSGTVASPAGTNGCGSPA